MFWRFWNPTTPVFRKVAPTANRKFLQVLNVDMGMASRTDG